MISDIRAYFDEQITMVDADLLAEDNDLFGNNDTSKPQAEKYYNLVIGVNNASRDGNSHWDAIDAALEIYSPETVDLVTAFDALYDKAIDIKNCIIDTKNYNQRFNDIELILMQPLEEVTNDNLIRIRLEFIVRRNFTF
jgi:hypothetical protein